MVENENHSRPVVVTQGAAREHLHANLFVSPKSREMKRIVRRIEKNYAKFHSIELVQSISPAVDFVLATFASEPPDPATDGLLHPDDATLERSPQRRNRRASSPLIGRQGPKCLA